MKEQDKKNVLLLPQLDDLITQEISLNQINEPFEAMSDPAGVNLRIMVKYEK